MSFSSSLFAENISDFQIEGMGIGDSALDYFSEEEILFSQEYFYKDDKFRHFELTSNKFKKYYSMHVYFKKNDNNYYIEGLAGTVLFKDNILDCYKELKEVDTYITSNFDYLSRQENEYDHPYDKSGKSNVKEVYYELKLGVMQLTCNDWSEELMYLDHLRIELNTSELLEFLYNDIYN